MSEDAFHRYVSLLGPCLERDSRYPRSKDPMFVELIVTMGIRYLGGN